MPKSIVAFVEDFAHRETLGALIDRVAVEVGTAASVEWRSAQRGHGRVAEEFRRFLRDLRRQGEWPSIVVVGTDANCQGSERRQLFAREDSPVPLVLAIPDPHVERWLLLDGAAFKRVFGRGCKAPDMKCAKDRYKQELLMAIREAGTTPSLYGIEFAGDIVREMDLERAGAADESLARFLSDLRRALAQT
jgi:hypothetical protein